VSGQSTNWLRNTGCIQSGTQWKKIALEALPKIFSSRRGAKHEKEEALKAALYQQIGQLKVELDWLKKVGLVG